MVQNSDIYCVTEGSDIPESLEKIILQSRDVSIINKNGLERKVISFVGFVINENDILISFPKHFSIDSKHIVEDAQLLMEILGNEIQKNKLKYFNYSTNLETNYPFNSFHEIYKYYVKYGLHKVKRNYVETGYNGKIAWKETINKSSKIISKDNLVFLPYKIKRTATESTFLSECMIFAINYTISIFSFFINLPSINFNLNYNKFRNKESVLQELYKIRGKTFKDIEIRLIDNLIQFFQNMNKGGNYYIKHYYFSSVWESMVENYLNMHFVGVKRNRLIFDDNNLYKNNFQKTIFYPNKINEEQNIQPDHFLIKGDIQFIFDSKYYNKIDQLNYKQVAYHFLLRNRVSDESEKYIQTISALILPSEKHHQKLHFVLKDEYNLYGEEFSIIECYLEIKKLMKLYIESNFNR